MKIVRNSAQTSRPLLILLAFFALLSTVLAVPPTFAAIPASAGPLAATPPMGWNDWAHYQCGYTAETILANAKALVKTGLASRGYNTVTIDDCWMQKDRDAKGDLQADPQRFPKGMKSLVQAVHDLGLHFGIYEDAGYSTCAGFAGSGEPKGRGKDHFSQDARLFASWGVDYLKLDGCNLYVPDGGKKEAVYRRAYAAQSAALKTVDRPIVFSESAPAYFMGAPEWYDVLSWVGDDGQLWREGTDMANFHANDPDKSRFQSVLWNYAYNLPLGRFQKPGNWNDPDFIIAGDSGLTLAESRSQMALWSMMSAPLILSSNVEKLSPTAIEVLGNKAVIQVDQDPLGRMATLVQRTPTSDILFKPLSNGDAAIAVLNRGSGPLMVALRPVTFGFAANADCRWDAQSLWNGDLQRSVRMLNATVAPHDTLIWRIHPSSACGAPQRIGAVTALAANSKKDIDSYTQCLADPGRFEKCQGTSAETWIVTAEGALRSATGRCLAIGHAGLEMQPCTDSMAQRWNYTRAGNLISHPEGNCLTAGDSNPAAQNLSVQTCGHNQSDQIWSLPN